MEESATLSALALIGVGVALWIVWLLLSCAGRPTIPRGELKVVLGPIREKGVRG